MLSMARTPVEQVLPYFAEIGVDVAFLVPTNTGYAKAIMDATAPVRDFLRRNGVHDYDLQGQGPEAKREYPAFFVLADRVQETTTSLYRPRSKMGDPRIWFRGLKQYCSPTDLLAVIALDERLYVFDLSDETVIESMDHGGVAAKLLRHATRDGQVVAMELLARLRDVARLGFVETLISGDTGIGMTLENLLGISANCSRAPDYKGIEIKATRRRAGKTANRVNLFSQVPDWAHSSLGSAQDVLNTYGYVRDGRRQLYCTVSASKPNPQGLYFHVAEDAGLLRNRSQVGGKTREVVQWDTSLLRARLEEKHAETFWVKADSDFREGREAFRYTSVTHTRKPNSHLLEALLSTGIITMDYTLSQQPRRVRDHGYLFKIHPENVSLLFPDPVHYELIDF